MIASVAALQVACLSRSETASTSGDVPAGDAWSGDPCQVTSGRQDLTIQDNLDDGEMWQTQLRVDGEALGRINLGRWGLSSSNVFDVWGYWRFQLEEPIEAGASITNARLTFRTLGGYGSWNSVATYGLEFSADGAADAAQVAAPQDHPGGTVTGTTVRVVWVPGPAVASTDSVTNDLAAIFQELVDGHAGLPAGAHVQLFGRGEAYEDDAEYGVVDFSAANGLQAALTVEWDACH